MKFQSISTESQREVLCGLDGTVQENISLLVDPAKSWQPSDFLPDMAAPDWYEQLAEFREPAKGLSDEVLVVLVGGMVTEEALPTYSISLNIIAEDTEGTSQRPWAKWLRGWTAEENRHGDLLNAFLRLTGRVEMRAIETTIHHLLNSGFNPRVYPDLYAALVYTSFQERATRISHNNIGAMAAHEGNAALGNICRRIAGDEARHEKFYTTIMGAVMEQDPAGGTLATAGMLQRAIAMPGQMMFDGRDPDLFDHFAAVAQRLGVYTVLDYSAIVRHLVATWRIAEQSLSDHAAKAQEFLCRHAERLEMLADRVSERIERMPKVRFSWIQDRLA
ncbi:MAG: acyl-ACP desaturase [Phycisphaeraceae bacterium]|nr:acyl-ACP desaturase [Phycisphaeraceae bacterium]